MHTWNLVLAHGLMNTELMEQSIYVISNGESSATPDTSGIVPSSSPYIQKACMLFNQHWQYTICK